jgi:predicted DNA-binding transcriptional regulator AlpA
MLPDPDEDSIGWLKALGDDGWITTKEAAELLGMTPGRLCRLCRRGRTPPNVAYRLSYRWTLWAYQEVDRWAAEESRR